MRSRLFAELNEDGFNTYIMKQFLKKFDHRLVHHCKKFETSLARLAIFIVYFWFGILKLLGLSPATPLVLALFNKTLDHFIPFNIFYIAFALFEMSIGILFLIRGLERTAIYLIGLHLFTTILPLFLLPQLTWQAFLVPTLEGQYIIKNILIVAIAVGVTAKLSEPDYHHTWK